MEFKAGSTIVVVCPFCRSALARTDRGLDDLGKVAEVAESRSPLRMGLKGTYKGHRYELTGRAQLRHEMGGFWDEWYATFANGWVGWLAEAQGRFYLTFFQPMPERSGLPAFDLLAPGALLPGLPNSPPLTVQEKGFATAAAAEGEIPYRLEPGERSAYADLTGPNNAFATIDYSVEPPWLFVGSEVTLADLGLADARPADRAARRVEAAAMRCPNCGGPLALAAPDTTERVTCPNCASLLDVNRGELRYLKALAPTAADTAFVLPMGATGKFRDGAEFKVIGAMVRSVTIEGETYYWHEYLLYNPLVGYRWLVHSANHWNFVEPVNAADVSVGFLGKALSSVPSSVNYNGRGHRIFQDARARVEYVKGEFYWRVEQGETVRAIDYVAAPVMLSQEISGSEVNWSAGTYLSVAEVEDAFGVKDLPKPWSVGPNQPFEGSWYYTWALLPVALLFIVAIFLIPLSGLSSTVYNNTITLQPAGPNLPTVAFSEPFTLAAGRNVRISASAGFNNSGADLDVDLVNEQNNEVESVNIPISYFHGVEDGESWTEGSPSNDATISSLPGGRYTLRVEGTFENISQPLPITLKVEQNITRGVNFICALIVLLIAPIAGIFRKFMFEANRWKDSMFGSASSSDD